VHQRTPTQTRHLRENPEALRYNSSDCPVYTGQCTVLQGRAASGTRQLRESPTASPLTVRCDNGAMDTSRQRSPATAINACQCAQKSGTRVVAHRTLYSTCPVCHRTSRRAQQSELQRSKLQRPGDVAVAPDMSGVHRTVRCTIRQTAFTNG
jgi:hypothetical protein